MSTHRILSRYTQKQIQDIVAAISPLEFDTRGGVGGIKYLNSSEVLKVTSPCYQFSSHEAQKILCTDLREYSPKPLMPHGDKLDAEYIDNYILEADIPTYLSDQPIKTFVRTKGYYFESSTSAVYLIQERASTDLTDIIKTADDLDLFLLQVYLTLLHLQNSNRFVHFDLHAGNVFYDRVSSRSSASMDSAETRSQVITINGKEYTLNRDWYPKIADFGQARMQYGDKVLIPLVNSLMKKPFGKYDPYYDYLSLLFFMRYYHTSKYFRRFSQHLDDMIEYVFQDSDLDHREIIQDFTPDVATNRGWRPHGNFIEYTGLKNLQQVVDHLLNRLISSGSVKVGNSTGAKPVSQFTTSPDSQIPPIVVPFRDVIVPGQIRSLDDPVNRQVHQILPGCTYNITQVSLEELIDNRFVTDTRDLYLTGLDDTDNIIMHTVTVSPDTARPAAKGPRLDTICCDVDAYEYLSGVDNGIAISGVYFQFSPGQIRRPIGPFKNSRYQSNVRIPELYSPDYAFIVGSKDGTIDMTQDQSRITKAEFAFSCGPILVQDSKLVFTASKARDQVNGAQIYSCDNAPRNTPKVVPSSKYPDQNVYNCKAITPGELAHANNPNPRAALVIFQDNSYGFVYIEGRKSRGSGVGMTNLAELCYTIRSLKGAPVKHALNLDGGGTAVIAYRSKGGPVSITNPMRRTPYMMGNLLVVRF